MSSIVCQVANVCELVIRDKLISEPASWHQWISKPFFVVDREVSLANSILSVYPDAPIIQLKAGEGIKSLATYEALIEALMCASVDRSWTLVAIGGGSLLDAVGFAAATYHRGLNWVAMPTTCLAQVDASVGGKTGINFRGHKNVLGVIHQPKAVIIDPTLLASLPPKRFSEGLAEVIKTGLLDHELWAFLQLNFTSILGQSPAILNQMITKTLNVKKRFVQADPLDNGTRMSLNLGHTLAHALELRCGLSHGEAVAIGLNFALFLSERALGTPKTIRARLLGMLQAAGLPKTLPPEVDCDELVETALRDKKRRGSQLNFIGLSDIANIKRIQKYDRHELADKLREFQASYANKPLMELADATVTTSI